MSERMRAWRLITTVLFGPAPERAAALPALVRGGARHWRNVINIANAHFVTPALWPVLRRESATTEIPEEFVEYLRSICAVNESRNLALLGQADEIVARLNKCGIVPTFLKGMAYLEAGVYTDLGARFLSDMDILVPKGQLAATTAALEQLGYRPTNNDKIDYARDHHHLHPLYRQGRPGVVEIHREAVGGRGSDALGASEILGAVQQHCRGELRYGVPSPTHAITLSFLHSVLSNRHLRSFVLGLRPMQDLVAMHSAHGAGIDWSSVESRLARCGYRGWFLRYVHAAGRITGVRPLPQSRFGWRDRLHYRLCEAGVARPGLERWLSRLARVCGREPGERGAAGALRRRLATAGGMLAGRLGPRRSRWRSRGSRGRILSRAPHP